jgi:hypothetical protein
LTVFTFCDKLIFCSCSRDSRRIETWKSKICKPEGTFLFLFTEKYFDIFFCLFFLLPANRWWVLACVRLSNEMLYLSLGVLVSEETALFFIPVVVYLLRTCFSTSSVCLSFILRKHLEVCTKLLRLFQQYLNRIDETGPRKASDRKKDSASRL